MQEYASANVSLSLKIVASAVFNAYHPDEDTYRKYGLSSWDNNLSNKPVSNIHAFLHSSVDLLDFWKAHMIAKDGLSNDLPGLQDDIIANIIRNYVRLHKVELAEILSHKNPASDLNDLEWAAVKVKIYNSFGNLTITEKDIADQKLRVEQEELLKQTQMQVQQDLGVKIARKIEKIFQLSVNQCSMSFSNPDSYFVTPPQLDFKSVEAKILRQYFDYIESLGLSVSYINFPTMGGWNRGIVFSTPLHEVIDTLNTLPDNFVFKPKIDNTPYDEYDNARARHAKLTLRMYQQCR